MKPIADSTWYWSDGMTDFFTHHFYAGARVEAQAGAVGQALEDQGLRQGTMLSPTKTSPEGHTCFFNGCIFIKEPKPLTWRTVLASGGLALIVRPTEYRQVWWGDIDITASRGAILAAADACGQDLWVTRERYRFDGYHGEDDGAVFFKHA